MTHPGGTPTEYSEEILIKTKEYMEKCVDEIEEYHKTRGDKSDTYERIVRVKLPSIEGLASYLRLDKSTIYAWRKEVDKKEFSYLINELLAKQAEALINNGLSGDYSPVIAKVLLTKHGYSDKTEIDLRDKSDEPTDDELRDAITASVGGGQTPGVSA